MNISAVDTAILFVWLFSNATFRITGILDFVPGILNTRKHNVSENGSGYKVKVK
jgi:hypothetical protein